MKNLGFLFVNKLKTKHIEFIKYKINVGLAAQTLSSSVNTTIDFLWKEANLPEFEGSEAAADFIRKVVMNSRNLFAKGFKQQFHWRVCQC